MLFTEIDEHKGFVKTYWENIRKRVGQVEPKFTKLIDELSPDKKFPIFLAYFPYGALIGDSRSQFIPHLNGDYSRLSDPNLPNEIVKHLGYGKDSSPMGMILEKKFEYFLDFPQEKISIPWLVYEPGSFFCYDNILNKSDKRTYEPNGILTMCSGARSAFLLPNIGCNVHHTNLQRDFNVQTTAPKTLYEHWFVFKEITKNYNNWQSCLLYFSENWVTKIQNDKAWMKIKTYLHELAWKRFEFERNRIYYDIAFSVFQKNRNLKPNPYLVDTARHLFTIALGAAPGYAPSCDDDLLPKDLLQNAYVESYGLKKYIPTILQPVHFNFEKDKFPIYYSLQNPSTYIFSPKSRKLSSTLVEMRELEHLMRVFSHEFSKKEGLCENTIIDMAAKNLKFIYYHNKPDRHNIVKNSEEIKNLDKRFNASKNKSAQAQFASDAPFVRGCISICKQ